MYLRETPRRNTYHAPEPLSKNVNWNGKAADHQIHNSNRNEYHLRSYLRQPTVHKQAGDEDKNRLHEIDCHERLIRILRVTINYICETRRRSEGDSN